MTEGPTFPDEKLLQRMSDVIVQVYPALIASVDRRAVEAGEQPLSDVCGLADALKGCDYEELVVERQTLDISTGEWGEGEQLATGKTGYLLLAHQFSDHVMEGHSEYGPFLDGALGEPHIEKMLRETAALKEEAEKLRPRGVG